MRSAEFFFKSEHRNRMINKMGKDEMGTETTSNFLVVSPLTFTDRTFSPPRHWRGPEPDRANHSAPSRQGLADDEEAAYTRAASRTPELVPSEPDSDSELLDQVLEECEEDGPRFLPAYAPRWPPCRGSGDCCSRPAEGGGEEIAGQREAAEGFLTRSTPGSNNFANQLPLKKPERQAKISYDCSEEELMATIEQEYCR